MIDILSKKYFSYEDIEEDDICLRIYNAVLTTDIQDVKKGTEIDTIIIVLSSGIVEFYMIKECDQPDKVFKLNISIV